MKPKTVIVDSDSIIYSAASFTQESYITVKHKQTGWEKDFPSVTILKGSSRKKDTTEFPEGCWLYEVNKSREEDKRVNIKDFEIETKYRFLPKIFGGQDSMKYARKAAVDSIEAIRKKEWCGDLKIVLAGPNNFRKDICKDYKVGRPPKPIKMQEIKDYIIDKYKDDVIISDNCEADDVCTIYGWEGYRIASEKGDKEECPYIIASIDKDLQQVSCWFYNQKQKDEPVWISPKKAYRNFLIQMLMGDRVDAIPGLPGLTKNCVEYYGIKNYRGGLGKSAATQLLHSDLKVKEMVDRVVTSYYYYCNMNDGWQSEEDNIHTWRDYLQQQFQLLRLMEKEGEIPCVERFCKEWGVGL